MPRNGANTATNIMHAAGPSILFKTSGIMRFTCHSTSSGREDREVLTKAPGMVKAKVTAKVKAGIK
jgi:hypothetical protein